MKNSYLGGRGKVALNRKRATSPIFSLEEKRSVSTKQEYLISLPIHLPQYLFSGLYSPNYLLQNMLFLLTSF